MNKDNYVKRPQLDEFDLQAIQMEIELAYKRRRAVSVTTWHNGDTNYYNGKNSILDQRLNLISLDGPFGEDETHIVNVIRAECLD